MMIPGSGNHIVDKEDDDYGYCEDCQKFHRGKCREYLEEEE